MKATRTHTRRPTNRSTGSRRRNGGWFGRTGIRWLAGAVCGLVGGWMGGRAMQTSVHMKQALFVWDGHVMQGAVRCVGLDSLPQTVKMFVYSASGAHPTGPTWYKRVCPSSDEFGLYEHMEQGNGDIR